MLEYWNNGLKAHNFCVWIKGFGINFDCFSVNDDEKRPNILSFQLPGEAELSSLKGTSGKIVCVPIFYESCGIIPHKTEPLNVPA